MKKLLIITALCTWSFIVSSQELTTPQIVGTTTGKTMSVIFPFNVKGIPFSAIPNSVWNAQTYVVAELQMSYNIEGDAIRYGNKSTKKVRINSDGSWSISGLSVEPHPYPAGKKLIYGKTEYGLFIYQLYGTQRSASWNASITPRITRRPLVILPNQKLDPVINRPKKLKKLNPQPIPPKEKLKTSNF